MSAESEQLMERSSVQDPVINITDDLKGKRFWRFA